MKLILVIQARMGSSRLPSKMMLPFFEKKGILEIIILQLKQNFPASDIIVATTKIKSDDPIEDLAKQHDLNVIRGSELDVLDRFVKVGDEYKSDFIVRICADNPFISIKYIKTLISYVKIIKNNNFDYVSYMLKDNIPVIKSHIGMFVELVRSDALRKVSRLTKDKLYREHVTNFIYGNPGLFKIMLLKLPKELASRNDIRLTIDTIEDFELLKNVYKEYYTYGPNRNINQLLKIIDDSKDILTIMKQEILKNGK